MPALPSCRIEPRWVQREPLFPARSAPHALGCHRPRIPDRSICERLVQVLVFGAADWRVADTTCSATTLRRRRDERSTAGVMDQLDARARAAYDRRIGLDLADVAVDGGIAKAPCGGELAGPSPVDRAQQGRKRSNLVDAAGIPLGGDPPPPTPTTRPCWRPRWTPWASWRGPRAR